MTLQSMTGFARQEGQFEDVSWVWELRSVNGKGLDIRFRIPQGYEALESIVRKSVQSALGRGNIQISLQIKQTNSNLVPAVNEAALEKIVEIAGQLQSRLGGDPPSAADLLGVRGVVELEEATRSESAQKALELELSKSFETALASLCAMRSKEGAAIADVLSQQIDKIDGFREGINQNQERTPEAIGERLREQVEKLLRESDTLDPQRLHQEAVLLAAKADIQEELDRLAVHITSATELLGSKGPVGRKLDFISQEFNRECNTICSKSNSPSVSSLGLEMKLVIDQFREQVQNME